MRASRWFRCAIASVVAGVCSSWIVAGPCAAASRQAGPEVSDDDSGHLLPDVYRAEPQPRVPAVAQDTVWIADWTFDAPGGGCAASGWTWEDGRNWHDGTNYWQISNAYDGLGGVVGNAAVLSKHDLCWPADGYGHDWNYSIVLKYRGSGCTLSLRYLSDTESGFDFFEVLADSGGAAESRAQTSSSPFDHPDSYRIWLLTVDGQDLAGNVQNLALPAFGVPAVTHLLYVRFRSDGGFDDEDGLYPTALHAALVVDEIQLTGGLPYTEDFTDGDLDAPAEFANTGANMSFGRFSRLYLHATDNDKCTENTGCAWIWTDPGNPSCDPAQQYGPGGAGVRRYLDDAIVSPWIAYRGQASGPPVLSYRRFGGNTFGTGCIVQGWSVRSRYRVDAADTPQPGDSVWCVTGWAHASQFNSLSSFTWVTRLENLTPWVDTRVRDLQVRFRTTDFGWIADCNPFGTSCLTGPGPYLDRIRIGRVPGAASVSFAQPSSTSNTAQDAFAANQSLPAPGQPYVPTQDRFGTVPFSSAQTRLSGIAPLEDSLVVQLVDAAGVGVASLAWYGAIVAGPHAGKAPAPYAVGANGFFAVTPDSCRAASGTVVASQFFVDLDDRYLRGGDRLVYFWMVQGNDGRAASQPSGLSDIPGSIADAEVQTGGLFEVTALPSIDWSPAYLSRIASDPTGALEPTPAEIAASAQHACILYYQLVSPVRRSGEAQRTHFMYTLDRLGYEDSYDVYDQRFVGLPYSLSLTSTPAQAAGYSVIVEDLGRSARSDFYQSVPSGQSQWYRDWLAAGAASPPGQHTLWMLAENLMEAQNTLPLFTQDMGVGLAAASQPAGVNPRVVGQVPFTFHDGNGYATAADDWQLASPCSPLASYDAVTATGTAVVTHAFTGAGGSNSGAVVMNKNTAAHWNSIYMAFNWADIVPLPETSALMSAILPSACRAAIPPVDTADLGVARRSVLRAVTPNPFNPATRIEFDAGTAGRVCLQVFTVDGKLVRTLLDGAEEAGPGSRVWNGVDASGSHVASGVYLVRLQTPDGVSTRRAVLLR